jgi:hypothetical protein
MSRHVLHVESKGWPTPGRVRRQRAILSAVASRYRPVLPEAGGAPPTRLRPRASFAFSMHTSPEVAVARIVDLLDVADPGWREVLHVWDGVRGGLDRAVRA